MKRGRNSGPPGCENHSVSPLPKPIQATDRQDPIRFGEQEESMVRSAWLQSSKLRVSTSRAMLAGRLPTMDQRRN
jgi:hypothetical protein